MKVAELRARSRGDQWRFKHIMKTKLLTRNDKELSPLFTLLPSLRNHYTVGLAYLCSSIPSALPHAPKLHHTGFSSFSWLTTNEMLFPCLFVWLASPIIQASTCCCLVFFFFVKMYFKPNHHALWQNLWSIPINLQEEEIKDAHIVIMISLFLKVPANSIAKRNKP